MYRSRDVQFDEDFSSEIVPAAAATELPVKKEVRLREDNLYSLEPLQSWKPHILKFLSLTEPT